jgi:hypothetical protein
LCQHQLHDLLLLVMPPVPRCTAGLLMQRLPPPCSEGPTQQPHLRNAATQQRMHTNLERISMDGVRMAVAMSVAQGSSPGPRPASISRRLPACSTKVAWSPNTSSRINPAYTQPPSRNRLQAVWHTPGARFVALSQAQESSPVLR